MSGGRLFILFPSLLFCACSSTPPSRTPPPARVLSPPSGTMPVAAHRPPEPAPRTEVPAPEPLPEVRFPQVERGPVDPKPGAKVPGTLPTGTERPDAAAPDVDGVLELQRRRAASRPGDEEEQLRLAALLAVSGDLEEAERVLSTVRSRSNRMLPYLRFYLSRQLGNHREATRLLEDFNVEEKRATGFVIGCAELCTKVRRYREYVRAESDTVSPGSAVLLYIEPRNFALQQDQDGSILHLEYRWELFDSRSRAVPVAAWDEARLSDRQDRIVYAGPVEEFYQSFRLPLPKKLEAGVYRIKVTVTDVNSGKSDRRYVPITVAGRKEAR